MSLVENKETICVGVITSANGVRGQVKIRSFTESPSDIANFNCVFDKDEVPYNIKLVSSKKDYIIAGIDGVSSRNHAETLRNTKLFIKRAELPTLSNDEFYHADLVGLEARDIHGIAIGVVRNVINYGAGDIIEISDLMNHKTEYYPFTKQFVPEVNVSKGFIVITPQEEVVASTQVIDEEE